MVGNRIILKVAKKKPICALCVSPGTHQVYLVGVPRWRGRYVGLALSHLLFVMHAEQNTNTVSGILRTHMKYT